MLYLIKAAMAHRTIARLFAAYDVVIVDLPLRQLDGDHRFAYCPVDPALSGLISGVTNTCGLNAVTFNPGENEIVSPGDSALAMHVVAGLQAYDEARIDLMNASIRLYPSVKNHASQRLLVLTDSLFITDEPYDWARQDRVAVVHVEGI